MILGVADIGAITLIIGILVSPLYMLFISLNRSYSRMNRELGELTKESEQNAKVIEDMKGSVDKLMKTWSGWVKDKH